MSVVIFLAPSEETGSGQTAAAPELPPPAGPSAVAKGDQGHSVGRRPPRRRAGQGRAAQARCHRKRPPVPRTLPARTGRAGSRGGREPPGHGRRPASRPDPRGRALSEHPPGKNPARGPESAIRTRRSQLPVCGIPGQAAARRTRCHSAAGRHTPNPRRRRSLRNSRPPREPNRLSKRATWSPPPAVPLPPAAGSASRAASGSKPCW